MSLFVGSVSYFPYFLRSSLDDEFGKLFEKFSFYGRGYEDYEFEKILKKFCTEEEVNQLKEYKKQIEERFKLLKELMRDEARETSCLIEPQQVPSIAFKNAIGPQQIPAPLSCSKSSLRRRTTTFKFFSRTYDRASY